MGGWGQVFTFDLLSRGFAGEVKDQDLAPKPELDEERAGTFPFTVLRFPLKNALID